MSLRINLNSAAMTAHRNLSGTDSAMGKSIERLSSGLKINSAGDDPAGLVISEKLRAQVSGLSQGIKNSGDAVNMVKTAEGALNEVSSVLRSMRDLALHARNSGANDGAALDADQQQIASAIDTLNKISSETQFGNKKLLDGSAGIKASISGTGVASANVTSGISADTDVQVNITQQATKATTLSKAAAVDIDSLFGATTFSINGINVTTTAADKFSDAIAKINAVSDQTGVIAETALTAGDQIKLNSKDYGSTARIDIASGAGFSVAAAVTTSAQGLNAVATVTTDGVAAVGTNGTNWNQGYGLTLKSDQGDTINLTETGNTAGGNLGKQMALKAGELSFQVGAYQGQTRTLTIGSTAADQIGKVTIGPTNYNVANIDVRSTTGADAAIKVLDQAITDVSTLRAKLGAFQKNVLESNINSLNVAKENISASESSIRDTDMAEEMIQFTRNQIMQQAGTAMLSQANQAPQQLLSLLR